MHLPGLRYDEGTDSGYVLAHAIRALFEVLGKNKHVTESSDWSRGMPFPKAKAKLELGTSKPWEIRQLLLNACAACDASNHTVSGWYYRLFFDTLRTHA
jgi:hypothetical protein